MASFKERLKVRAEVYEEKYAEAAKRLGEPHGFSIGLATDAERYNVTAETLREVLRELEAYPEFKS